VQNEARIKAFQSLFSKCLKLTAGDELLVVYDESMRELLGVFEQAIASEAISTTLVYLPKVVQDILVAQSRTHGPKDKVALPSGIVAAITASTAMLNVLDSYAENAPVRRAINRTPRPNTCRLATIPGISDVILQAILDARTEEIVQSCEEVAWLLGEASSAEIVSLDSLSREYRLRLALGGWENEPIMSPGVLLPGSWGNVPPGETFCCPPPDKVNGQICINGSIPGRVLKDGEEILLEFDRGKLLSWKSPFDGEVSPAAAFFDELQAQGKRNQDENWNTFAELGLGLNPDITGLTGNPLFDEKASRTLHVAIGDNSVFGDDVTSFIHEDLITRHPSLYLDGHLVMKDGVIDRTELHRRRGEVISDGEGISISDAVIYLREGRIGQHNGVLMRRLSKAQRVNYVRMGPDDLSAALSEVCDMLQTYERVHIATFLKAHPTFQGVSTAWLLNILKHYAVVGYEAPRQ
jgi:hypothetical protein